MARKSAAKVVFDVNYRGLQCDRACYGAEIVCQPSPLPTNTSFNVTAPVMARK